MPQGGSWLRARIGQHATFCFYNVKSRSACDRPSVSASRIPTFDRIVIFPACTLEEKGALVDALVKKVSVDADKTVESELYAEGDLEKNVVPKIKVGSPS